MDKIREQILHQARAEAAGLVRAAEEEAERRVNAGRERAARDLESRLAHFNAELEREHEQAVDRVAFEHRLDALRRKREILDAVFEEAKARFVEMPHYRAWLERRLADVADLDGEVLCNRRDRAVCRTALAASRRTGLTLAEEDANPGARAISGGIIVRTERFDLDLSLEWALNDLRARVMPDLIALAFSGLEEVQGQARRSASTVDGPSAPNRGPQE